LEQRNAHNPRWGTFDNEVTLDSLLWRTRKKFWWRHCFALSLLTAANSMYRMLDVSGDILPATGLAYTAFRVSFQDTLERIVLSKQFDDGNEIFGYLTEVPFLMGVPPHVQLDLLADTWSKHTSKDKHEASLIDESVIYAACETAARIAEEDPNVITHSLITGPRESTLQVDAYLPGEFRNLHLSLANEGDFLLASQFEDMNPIEAFELKMQFQIDMTRLEEMFDVLVRWRVHSDLQKRIEGLVTERELLRIGHVIGEALQYRAPKTDR
jgi:hypothetical protein